MWHLLLVTSCCDYPSHARSVSRVGYVNTSKLTASGNRELLDKIMNIGREIGKFASLIAHHTIRTQKCLSTCTGLHQTLLQSQTEIQELINIVLWLCFCSSCSVHCRLYASRVYDFLQHKIQTTNQEMTVMQDFKSGFKTAAFLIWQPSFGFYTM
jgi:hypothetical protein